MSSHVRVTRGAHEDVVHVTLARPAALNALTLDMIRALRAVFAAAPRLVVLQGEGRAFCAGGDVVHICKSGRAMLAGQPHDDATRAFFAEEYALNHAIAAHSAPHAPSAQVALLNGVVMGGGVGVSVHGAYRVACEQTLFAMPETAIGFFPDVGGSWVLPRLPHSELGTYLALTGARLKGKDVVRAGIATHFVSHARFPELEAALSKTQSRAEVDAVLAEFARGEEGGAVLDAQQFDAGLDLAEIARCFAFDRVEDIVAALQASSSPFAAKTLALLTSASPTALKVTLRLMRLGARSASLAECLQREFALTQRSMQGHDFYEGVRALLIDKDQQPQWSPRTLDAVSDAAVDEAFTPLAEHLPWRPDIRDYRDLDPRAHL